ncbi:MAG: ABC transporter permease, partial [Proteobacteria bacterium]
MMLLVFFGLLIVSPTFRRLYVKWVPELWRVAKLALFILTAVWATAFFGVLLFNRSSFSSPIFWGFFAFSYVGLLELLFSTGPAMAGVHRLLGDKVAIITRVGTVIAFCTFLGFTAWAMNVPQPRGPTWSIAATGIRVAAILSGLLTLLLLLGAVLPVVINLLERRSFVTFVGARHVRSKKSGFLTVISLLSILGVALSSCTLGSVVSVMGGFSADLKRKILGNNAHIVVDRESLQSYGDYEPLLDDLRAMPGVVGATPVVHGEVMIASASNLAGVLVRGIDPKTIHSVIDLPEQIEVGSFTYLEHPEQLADLPADTVIGLSPKGEPYLKGPKLDAPRDDIDPEVRAALQQSSIRSGLIIGRELAKTLHLLVGDEVTLVSPMGDLGPMGLLPRTRKFRIAAVFYSGMYEYDASHVYTTLDAANEYFQLNGKVNVIDIKVEDAERIDDITKQIADKVGTLFLDGDSDITM